MCFRQSLIFPECNHLHQATCASYDAFVYKSNFWPVQINILLFTFYPVNHMVSLTWLSNFFFFQSIFFQGMKLLPTGRKSSLAIFAYSTVVSIF